MWTATLYEHPLPALQWGAVLGAALVGAATDAAARRIPNWLTGPFLLAGLVAAGFVGGLAGLADAGAGCVMLALPYVLLFLLAGGGAGDAKLMGAIGAWLGVVWGAVALAAVCLSGVVLALAHAWSKNRLGPVLKNLSGMTIGMLYPLFGGGSLRDAGRHLPAADDGLKMPYGPAIFAGTALAAGGSFLWHGW